VAVADIAADHCLPDSFQKKLKVHRIRQNLHRIRDASVVLAGIILFAAFIHDPWPLRGLGLAGLAGAAVWIAWSIRHRAFLPAFGLSRPDRKILLYAIPAILLGLLLGIFTRHKFDLSTWPTTIGILALLSPCIGAGEELVFRGYMQGHLLAAGRIFSLLCASMAHTGYKIIVILSLSAPMQFDLFFLALWTFLGGLAFGVLRDLSRSSVPPVMAHAIFDIMLYGGLSAAPLWVWS
jgi:membrane protease YdiL (CAAX protease family)